MCALMTSAPTTMTADDGVADACAAIPCVLAPPPTPALDNLPMELIRNIVKFIPGSPVRELLALRRTCRFFRAAAAYLLCPRMRRRLRHIRVLMTKDGLTALLEITSVVHWRNCIQCVEFIDPGVDAIREYKKGDRDKYHWLGYTVESAKFREIQNKVRRTSRTGSDLGECALPITPVRQLFWANYAPVLLEKIFSSFKTMEGLGEIHFGSRSSAHKPLPRSEPFIMSIGFGYAHTNLARCLFQRIYNREIGTYISAGHMRLLHRILSDTGFDKGIVHLNMRNLTGTERLSLPGVWPYLDHPSFQKLNFVDVDHAHPVDNIRAPSIMRLDPKYERLNSRPICWNITELRLIGCKTDSSCAVDYQTFSLLAKSRFPHLIRLELIGYAVTSEQLIPFLRSVNSTTRDVFLTSIHLTSGSWKTVLREIRAFERVRETKFKTLSEMKQQYWNGRFAKLVVIA